MLSGNKKYIHFPQISAVSKGVCAYEDATLLNSRGVARNFPGYSQFSNSTHTSVPDSYSVATYLFLPFDTRKGAWEHFSSFLPLMHRQLTKSQRKQRSNWVRVCHPSPSKVQRIVFLPCLRVT